MSQETWWWLSQESQVCAYGGPSNEVYLKPVGCHRHPVSLHQFVRFRAHFRICLVDCSKQSYRNLSTHVDRWATNCALNQSFNPSQWWQLPQDPLSLFTRTAHYRCCGSLFQIKGPLKIRARAINSCSQNWSLHQGHRCWVHPIVLQHCFRVFIALNPIVLQFSGDIACKEPQKIKPWCGDSMETC